MVTSRLKTPNPVIGSAINGLTSELWCNKNIAAKKLKKRNPLMQQPGVNSSLLMHFPFPHYGKWFKNMFYHTILQLTARLCLLFKALSSSKASTFISYSSFSEWNSDCCLSPEGDDALHCGLAPFQTGTWDGARRFPSLCGDKKKGKKRGGGWFKRREREITSGYLLTSVTV